MIDTLRAMVTSWLARAEHVERMILDVEDDLDYHDVVESWRTTAEVCREHAAEVAAVIAAHEGQ
jgi:hypothetical protein